MALLFVVVVLTLTRTIKSVVTGHRKGSCILQINVPVVCFESSHVRGCTFCAESPWAIEFLM